MNQKKRKTRKEKEKEHLEKLRKEGRFWGEEEIVIDTWISWVGWLMALAFFVSLFFMHKTIVSSTTLLKVSFLISLGFVAYLYICYKESMLMSFDEIYVYLYFWGILIGFICCLLVLINAIPIYPETEIVKVKILEWENRKPKRGRRKPWAEIEYGGYRSSLPFAKYSLSQVKDIDSMTIHVRKGLLGYGIVKSARLDGIAD